MDADRNLDDRPDAMSWRPAPRRDWWVRLLSWAVLAVVIGFVVFCGIWRAQGGRWERVETPSMGTVAPVGTLLWIKPTRLDHLRVGDFITFHPPGHGDLTYSHRVFRINADHTVTTKGVIPAPDPWRLTQADLVGKVEMRWWGVGWIVRAGPLLLAGAVFVAAIRAMLARDWRLPATILLSSLVITLAIVWYRPFVNAEQLGFAPTKAGGATATYVGTGLLPIRLRADGGASVVMRDGQVGSVHVATADARREYRVHLESAVPWWVWLVLVLGCFVPALYSLLVGFAPLPEEVPRHAAPAT